MQPGMLKKLMIMSVVTLAMVTSSLSAGGANWWPTGVVVATALYQHARNWTDRRFSRLEPHEITPSGVRSYVMSSGEYYGISDDGKHLIRGLGRPEPKDSLFE